MSFKDIATREGLFHHKGVLKGQPDEQQAAIIFRRAIQKLQKTISPSLLMEMTAAAARMSARRDFSPYAGEPDAA